MLAIPSQYMHYCLVLLCEVYCVIVRIGDHCCVLCDVSRDLLLPSYIVRQPIRAKLPRSKAVKLCLSLYFHCDFIFGDKTYTVDGEIPFLCLPAFLSPSSDCCGGRNFFIA